MHTKLISSILFTTSTTLAAASSLLPRQTNDTCLASNGCINPDGCIGSGDLREFV
ncbi:hypothetical protein BT96DRAFT_917987, partial [Gymnopus androsaceus JB14]